MNNRVQRSVFISRLDHELQEQTPVGLLKSQFRQNTLANFILVEGQLSPWLKIYNNRRFQRLPGRIYTDTFGVNNRLRPTYGYMDASYSQATAVRLTLLDKHFKIKKDSLIQNDRKIFEMQPFPIGQFIMNERGYLVLIENFTPKRKGLLLLGTDQKDQLTVTALPVYDRYDYLLTQLQFVNDKYFIVPFVTKNEMGLMKVTMK